MTIQDYILVTIHYKKNLAVLFLGVLALEWYQGYFKELFSYLKHLSLRIKSLPLFLLPFSMIAFGLFWADPYWWEFFQDLCYNTPRRWIELGAFLGNKHLILYLLLGYFCLYFASKRIPKRSFLRDMIFAGLLSGALTGGLKFLTGRARPFMDQGALSFGNFYQAILEDMGEYQSFPSGDVAVVAGVAIYLIMRGRSIFWSWILIFPFLTALSRLDVNRHWPSDVIASFFPAFAAASFILGYARRREQKSVK